MTLQQFDLVILGGGNAGLAAANVAKRAGKTVVIIESRALGGTCPLRGCVPKKVLVAAAETLNHIALAPQHHITTGPASLDWAKLIERKQTFVDGVPESLEHSLSGRGIRIVHGRARFVDRHTVSVDGTPYQGKKILIATGSKPYTLPIPGFEHTITSDDILNMKQLPSTLVFIGAGVIAFEFAHVLARAGVKVTLLERSAHLLPMFERELVNILTDETRRLGVQIMTDLQVESVVSLKRGFQINTRFNGDMHTVNADVVANGAGRIADIDNLNLDAAGIYHGVRGIDVDRYLRSTSNLDVLVAGDALRGPQLSPVATYEGRIAGHNLYREEMISPEYRNIPQAIYTVPSLASVGLTEAQADEQGLKFHVRTSDMREWRSARTYAETAAYAKVLKDGQTDHILGAHILGHGAEEIIHIFALAIKYGIPARELADGVYAYPTFSSDIKYLV